MGIFRCNYCKKIKTTLKGNLCEHCNSIIKSHSQEIKSKIDSLQYSKEQEFKRNTNLKNYILDTIEILKLYKKLYEYANYFPNEIILEIKDFETLKHTILEETKLYIKYRINHYPQDYLKILKEDFEYLKSIHPEYKELFDTSFFIDDEEFLIETNETIEEIDNLNGIEFEEYMGKLLTKLNYKKVKVTKASNDYGIDVLCEKDGVKYAIQCKNYQSPLGNKCVQEAYSGKQYYNCHIGIVATNSTFTSNAKKLAEKNGVLLWDRNILKKMITLANKKR